MENEELQRHFLYQGRFCPFNYTIGLETNLEEALQTVQSYPLAKPISQDRMDTFIKSLTFFHEVAHLAQYISCSYGLRTLRLTVICINYLLKGRRWEPPVVPSLANRRDLDELEGQAFDRFAAFLDAADQLRLYSIEELTQDDDTQPARIEWEPWSPHFLLHPVGIKMDPATFVEIVDGAGGLVRRLPIIKLKSSPFSARLLLNAAALMEAYAVLTEMNHVLNAISRDMEFTDLLEFVPGHTGYLGTLFHALFSGVSKSSHLFPTLVACIDVALMYDPFTLYNSSVLEKPSPGQVPDRYPGETFIEACEAAQRITPVSDWTECPRFYESLCSEMGLPSPQWMADRAYEVASRLASQVVDLEHTLMGRAIHLHAQALKLRCEDAASFPFDLPISNKLLGILELAAPCVTFYNLHTRQPSNFDPRRLDLVQMHNLLFQVLMNDRVECPLKKGVPFYCECADEPDNILCVWQASDGRRYECWADFFDPILYSGDSRQ